MTAALCMWPEMLLLISILIVCTISILHLFMTPRQKLLEQRHKYMACN